MIARFAAFLAVSANFQSVQAVKISSQLKDASLVSEESHPGFWQMFAERSSSNEMIAAYSGAFDLILCIFGCVIVPLALVMLWKNER